MVDGAAGLDTIVAPTGFDGIVRTFGDPRLFVRRDGNVSPNWEAAILACPLPLPFPIPLGWNPDALVSRIRVHRLITEPTYRAFARIERAGLAHAVSTFDGAYAWRTQRGSNRKLSTHAWGIAIDLNAETNQLGERPTMHPGIVEAFEAEGFEWGGRWAWADGMHFQFARSY